MGLQSYRLGFHVFTICTCAQVVDTDSLRFVRDREYYRGVAVEMVSAAKQDISLLLSWTERLPDKGDPRQLKVAMADAFRELKVKDAIPFLIKNIQLTRFDNRSPWMKGGEVVEECLPAVAALIAIGPPASEALMRLYKYPTDDRDRLPALFAVSRIHDPKTENFLISVAVESKILQYWAEEGYRAFEAKSK